ncbi:MAG: restriction endonuclease subunit S [Pseudoalteromonas distincta]|uniref:restriction endonuclease subunit S n=1 Tax=Pseudoalteromonas distincta TaxID=77608 RepID=UPI003F9A4FFF
MTGRYKAYPKYKESELEWLGNVPEHWEVEYSKWLFQERNNKAKATDEMLTASQKYGVIPQKMFMKLEQQKVVQVQKGHGILKKVLEDDFVISMRSFQGGIEFCSYNGAVSSAYVPLEPKKRELSCFFKYLFKSKPFIQALQATSNLVRDGQALRYNNFIQVRLPVPTSEEAESISNFLDHETAKIDTLIAKQEKLIELLKEKRQAVISHAVTKGLNPNAPMRDSGVEWLGEVPEHWRKIAFKQVIKTRKGVAFSTSDFCDNGIRVVKASDIKQLSLNLSDVFLPKDFITKYPKAYLAQGNIILSTVGSTPDVRNSAVGQIAMVPQKLDKTLLNQNTVVFDPIGNAINRNYLFFVLQTRAYRDHLDLHAHGTANQASLNVADMLDFKCFIPLIDEQNQIAEYLKKLLRTVTGLETKANSAINLLRERKTALISAAVTGKIDVRDWKPQGV